MILISKHIIRVHLCALFFLSANANAHSPHDIIDALGFSPEYQNDSTLYIASTNRLFVSRDAGGRWSQLVNGLDNRFAFTSIAVSTTGTLFVSTDGDGVYRSLDGGGSWGKVNNGLLNIRVSNLIIQASTTMGDVILATGTRGGLYYSEDSAESWRQVLSSKVTAIDYGVSGLYIADENNQIWFSEDGGKSWTSIYTLDNTGKVTALENVIIDSRAYLLIATDGTGFHTFDPMSKKLTLSNSGLPALGASLTKNHITDITSVKATNGKTNLFVTTWDDGVYTSNDAGESWLKQSKGLTKAAQANSKKYKSAHFRKIIEATDSKDIYVTGFDGLFKWSKQAGEWQQMETRPVSLIKGFGISKTLNGKTSVGLATYGGGGYFSEDNGKNWVIANKGLRTTRLTDVTYSPDYWTDSTVYSGAFATLLKSTNRGNNWTRIETDPTDWKYIARGYLRKAKLGWLSNKVLGNKIDIPPYPTIMAISSDFSKDRTLFYGTRKQGVYRSSDAGKTSDYIYGRELHRVITDVALSPNFTIDKTIFVNFRGSGLYRSQDAGSTWKEINESLDFILKWASSTFHGIKKQDIAIRVSDNYAVDNTVFVASPEGIYKSTDKGDSWKPVAGLGLPKSAYIKAMALFTSTESKFEILLSIKGKGLYISRDGGDSFETFSKDLVVNHEAIAFIEYSSEYAFDKKIFAVSETTINYTNDGGLTWKKMPRVARYENIRKQPVQFKGQWKKEFGPEFSAGNQSYADTVGNDVVFKFVGTEVTWIGEKGPNMGMADVYVDGDLTGRVDLYAESVDISQTIHKISGLSNEQHEFKILAVEERNVKSKGSRLTVDAFDVR